MITNIDVNHDTNNDANGDSYHDYTTNNDTINTCHMPMLSCTIQLAYT